jgi:hypothetical protein
MTRAAVRTALRGAAAAQDSAAQVAQEVYEACLAAEDARGDDPLPLSVRGPLLAIGIRGAAAILAMRPELVRSAEMTDDLIEYLTETWVSTLMDFDLRHFEEWRRRTNVRGDGSALSG